MGKRVQLSDELMPLGDGPVATIASFHQQRHQFLDFDQFDRNLLAFTPLRFKHPIEKHKECYLMAKVWRAGCTGTAQPEVAIAPHSPGDEGTLSPAPEKMPDARAGRGQQCHTPGNDFRMPCYPANSIMYPICRIEERHQANRISGQVHPLAGYLKPQTLLFQCQLDCVQG